MNRLSDSYWFWRIAEGVRDTLMIAWKGKRSEEDIWKVIVFEHQFSHGGKAEEHNHPYTGWRAAGVSFHRYRASLNELEQRQDGLTIGVAASHAGAFQALRNERLAVASTTLERINNVRDAASA